MRRADQTGDLRAAFARHVCHTSPTPLGLVVARAAGTRIWDADGREYLDLLSGMGVANVGHAHPEVVRAVEQQARAYLHVSVYGEMVQQPQVELAQRLAALTPGDLSVVYFANSGAEAVEGALKTARKSTARPRFVAFEGAFHGDTFGALSVGGNPLYRTPFEPLLPDVDFLPFNDSAALARIDERVAAVIIEPVQAEGGVRAADPSFLTALRRRCDAVGALLIADEVMTGFGRTGSLFASAEWGGAPDVLVLAKALGGGMPLGAFVGRPALMRTLSHDPPLAHVTTFGGHPVSCAAGLAALDVIVRDNLAGRAARLGAEWRDQLERFIGRRVRAVRGHGLLMALEFEAAASAHRFSQRCFEQGVILNWTLHRDTVVRLAPPLTISADEVERATAVMKAAVESL